jgi:hypothetical protein
MSDKEEGFLEEGVNGMALYQYPGVDGHCGRGCGGVIRRGHPPRSGRNGSPIANELQSRSCWRSAAPGSAVARQHYKLSIMFQTTRGCVFKTPFVRWWSTFFDIVIVTRTARIVRAGVVTFLGDYHE